MEEEIERVVLVFSLSVASSYADRGKAQAEECPIWTVASNDTEGYECAKFDHLIVRCIISLYSVSVRIFHCMTADTDMNPVVGDCLYNSSVGKPCNKDHCHYNTNWYNKITTNSSTDINTKICSPYK